MIILMLSPSPRKQKGERGFKAFEPSVSVIVPVYNGGRKSVQKIENIYSVKFPRVSWKSSSYLMGRSNHEILLFTDVDSELDGHFIFAEGEVACVGGRALLINQEGQIGKSQSLYWKIEEFMRRKESDFGMVHSLPGWGLAERKSDFTPLDLDTGDDMILPMEMALRRKRTVRASDALVMDMMPSTMKGAFSARQRIALRNLTGLMRRKLLLAPWLFPKMSFALWSHKLLKWLSPVLIILVFLSSLYLYVVDSDPLYRFAFLSQVVFYCFGFVGLISFIIGAGTRLAIIGHISSFLLANATFLVALIKFSRGKR